MTEITEELAKRTVKISFDDLPPLMVRRTKQLLLDCIGCALGGYPTERSRLALDLVHDLGGNPDATIIGGARTSYPLAAYANGELVNALDYDPLGPIAAHPTPFVLSPTLALAERGRVSGKELIAALALACEIGGRVCHSLPGQRLPSSEPPYYIPNRGLSFGVAIFGGVAGGGRLLGLDTGQLCNAFGIAADNMPAPLGQKWEHSHGASTMAKYGCSTGMVAQTATMACLLAEKGFTADPEVLDGKWGLQSVFAVPYFNSEEIVADLGKVWHLDRITLKKFPCCGLNHTAIQALMRILEEHSISPEEIKEIVVMSDPWMLVPLRSRTEVISFADAQFANLYITALVPFFGAKPSPAWQMPEVYTDARVLSMMKKVKMVPHPRTGEIYGRMRLGGEEIGFRDVVVEVLARGKRYSAEERVVKGSPADPLSEQEIEAKFMTNASFSPLEAARARQVMAMVSELEAVGDISELMSLLRVD